MHPAALRVAALALLIAGGGCRREPAAPAARASGEAAALLARLDTSAVQQAFARAAPYAYTRISTLERLDAQGRRLPFGRRADAPSGNPERIVGLTLPADPPYRSARAHEDYRFRLGADTLLGGRRVQRLEIRLREGAKAGIAMPAVDFFFDPATRLVVAVRQQYRHDSAFYRERTSSYVEIRQTPAGDWVPAAAASDAAYKLLLGAQQRYRTTSRFEDYRQRR